MRGNEFQINYGGEWLDVDAQSVGGFDFTTLWTLDSTRITEKGRTLDLSVPATSKNTRVFNDHKLIPGDGVRRGINGMVVAGGVNITGTIYVSEYSGGRYSLMMAYGQSFGGFKRVNYAAAFAADTMTLVASDVPQSGGVVPDFGWYEYGNETAPHATVYDGGALLFPSANLGHIIDALAASLGYTVNYPVAALGRGYQAHAYGLVLPSFGVDSIQGGADVSGSAMNGFSYTMSGVATLADLGLEVVVQKRARGVTLELVDCEVFRATKPVHITIPANSNVVVFGNNSYTLYNDWEGTQGAEFDLAPGDTFSFARPNEWHKVAGEYYWNRYKNPPAFEGNVTVTFSVTRSTSNPIPGETMRLASALPEHPLEWWLDAYCNIIFAAWTVDENTKTITVKTYGERYGDALADAGNHISLEKEKVIAIESVKKYVDGFAQRNHTRCDGKYDDLGSVLPFDRVLEMDNEYLEQSRDMAVIPFNDGGIQGGHDERFYLYLNDVRPDGEGGYMYDGVLTVFFENNVNTDGAVSLQEILNMGVGMDMRKVDVINQTDTVVPSSYDPDYQAYSVANLTNAYSGITSTTYATIYLTRGAEEETWIFYNFSLNIPLNATINSVLVRTRSVVSTIVDSAIAIRQAQFYAGSTPKGSPVSLQNTTTTQTLNTGALTAAELNNAKIRWYCKRGTKNVDSSAYIRIRGAEIQVEYTYNDITYYVVTTAFTASVRLQLPLFRFAGIGGGTCVSLHGRDFVVRNAKWSEGVAQLEMMSVPRTILDVPRYFPNAIQDHDGNWYDAVVIGNQVWLAQNLRTTHYADGTPIPAGGSTISDTDPYYYDYSSSGIPLKDRGLLYNWPAVMNGAASSDLNPSGVQGIAPTGWHVPSRVEWAQLKNYVNSQSAYRYNNENNKIAKAIAYDNYWSIDNTPGNVGNDQASNNATLFGAIPSGYRYDSGFSSSLSRSCHWSCTLHSSSQAQGCILYYNDSEVYIMLTSTYYGYSVRCVCDLSPMDFAAWYYNQYGSYNHQL